MPNNAEDRRLRGSDWLLLQQDRYCSVKKVRDGQVELSIAVEIRDSEKDSARHQAALLYFLP